MKNRIIDYYRKKQTKEKHIGLYTIHKNLETEIDSEWEVFQKINNIYSLLHPKTLEIFQLSREKGLTYKEIAASKEISIKTVELHISKALKKLRQELKEYL